ncbi:MAG: sigma-70 family RNA polymerase sigma factor [Gemmatimonadaceae bacterium]|nr:sigma-70 family RNA polymerase sigma factor [Gemmatimonadaceae bacterium]
MSDRSTTLAALLAALTTARSPEDCAAAQVAFYTAARLALVPVCASLLRAAPVSTWQSPEDLAEDTLVDAIPALQRGACRDPRNDGVMRWLATVASRRLISEARRRADTCDTEVADVLRATYALNAHAEADTVHPMRHEYEEALAEVPDAMAGSWRVVIEEQRTKTDAAAVLGVHRTTVHHHVKAVRRHLATRLAHYAP